MRYVQRVLKQQFSRAVGVGILKFKPCHARLTLVYISDMPDYVTENWTLALFADDSKLYKGVFNLDDHENLQSDLDKLNHWCMDWNMEFNTPKCKALNMSRKIVKTQRAYGVLNSSTLEVVSQTTDRRITISNHLSWNGNPNKARKKLGLIRRLCRLNHQMRKVLYCSMVRPQLEYASELWSPYTIKHKLYLESV